MFIRSKKNPIIKPDHKHAWEDSKTYNPTVYYDGSVFHLYYRAVGKGGISSIGYAISLDGENFTRADEPILTPSYDQECKGVEDPRFSKVDNRYFLTYSAYDGVTARLSLATATKLNGWRRHGLAFHLWDFTHADGFIVPWDKARTSPQTDRDWSKAGAIFPGLVKGDYWMLFGDSDLWLALSENGLNWHVYPESFIRPRPGFFDCAHVEMGPAPLKTEYGWLVLYHGIDDNMVYRLGLLLLDLDNPQKILYRSVEPLFAPQAEYELTGEIDVTGNGKPKVIFCNGAAIAGSELRIYYGAADKYACTATADLDKIFDLFPKINKNSRQ